VPWNVLSDRGTFFTPGAFKKTAKERIKIAPHLWMHEDWSQPIGKHVAAIEDDKGFRIGVELNEAIPHAAQTLSNLRFGIPMGLSIGFDRIADRSGTPEDDAKLDRRTAPDWLKTLPINELRAITEARWWEASTVVFGAIATAKPDTIHSAGADALAALLAALKAGTLDAAQTAQITDLVAAYEAFAAAARAAGHSTGSETARPQITDAELLLAVAEAEQFLAERIAA